jgi:hypothetical protein
MKNESELEKPMTAQKPWRASLLIALLPAGLMVACTGKVSPSTSTGPGTSPTGNVSGSNTGSGGGGSVSNGTGGDTSGPPVPPPPQIAVDANKLVPESAGLLTLRRLTFSEYDHTLADLLGDTSGPGEDSGHPWDADAPGPGGFAAPDFASDQLIRNFDSAADAVVDAALAAGKITIPCTNPTAAQETACVKTFITTFGLKAFRRPVTTDEQTDLTTLFTTVRGLGLTFNQSIGAIVKGMIQSASFLYHWEIGPTKPVAGADGLLPLTQWQIASRLASNLWNTMPDDALLQAAQAGQLATPAQVLAQAQRMITDPRAGQSLNTFHQQWLLSVGTRVPHLDSISPAGLLTQAAVDGLSTEFSSFLSSVYSTGDGTLNTFLTAPYAYVNHDLAAIYGVPGPAAGAPSAKVMLDGSQRGGLFTQVAFLASFAAGQTDNPVFRGLSVYTKLLCGGYNPPGFMPPGVPFTDKGTTRQTYEVHGNGICAAACHGIFDPPGFAFENYDGTGKFRTTENSQPVDSTGTLTTPGGVNLTFTNAIDLMQQLASSPETAQCVERQWSRYILGRLETDAEAGSLGLAYQMGKTTPGFSLRDMLTAFVSSKSFTYRRPSPGEML